jgi:hypothetical protein
LAIVRDHSLGLQVCRIEFNFSNWLTATLRGVDAKCDLMPRQAESVAIPLLEALFGTLNCLPYVFHSISHTARW